jgi:hypothetical protein
MTPLPYLEYLKRRAHYIFQKKVKPGGSDMLRFFGLLGGAADTARGQVRNMVDEMTTAGSDGMFLKRHAADAALFQFQHETVENFFARAAAPWLSWRYGGSGSVLGPLAAAMGYDDMEVRVRSPNWSDITIAPRFYDDGRSSQGEFLATMRRRRPARSLFYIDISGDWAYRSYDLVSGEEGAVTADRPGMPIDEWVYLGEGGPPPPPPPPP